MKKKLIKKIVVWSDTQILQIFIITVLFLFILFMFLLTQKDVLSLVDITILSTFLITFFVTLLFNKSIDILRVHVEDEIKINYDFEKIKDQYPLEVVKSSFYKDNEDHFWPIIILYSHNSDKKITIKDSAGVYLLPSIISNYTDKILTAHKASHFKNNKMIRMDKIEVSDNEVNIFTSRTTYLNTLITNRAIDYHISQSLTVRDVLEPGPYINDLDVSTLSNHIGFNILVFDKDNNIVLSQRSNKVSTAKSKYSFGVSGSLKSIYSLDNQNKLSIKGIEHAIKMEIKDELGIDNSYVSFDFNEDLLCVYREVYEGGKPHFLLKCKINFTGDEIIELFNNNDGLKNLSKDSHSLKIINQSELYNSKISESSIELPDEIIDFAFTVTAPMKVAVDMLDKEIVV